MLPAPFRRPSSFVLAAAAALGAGTMLPAQSEYATIHSPRVPFFGEGVDIIGDVDGDGFDDYFVAARVEISIFSGRSGLEITSLPTPPGFTDASAAGDVDGDGTPDLIVGADDRVGPGTAMVLFGPAWTSRPSHTWVGTVPREGYGGSVKDIGDVDGDGVGDFAVTSPQLGTPLPGYVEVRSGRTGALLRRFNGTSVGATGDIDGDGLADLTVKNTVSGVVTLYSVASVILHSWSNSRIAFGDDAVGLGDIDMDGRNDLALSDEYFDGPNGSRSGAVRVYSGRTGKPIKSLWGQASERFGRELDVVGDLNGDGRPEILVGTGSFNQAMDTVYVIDVFNDNVLYSRTRQAERFGHWLGAGGDVNGDGVPDAIAGAPLAQPNGYAFVISGADLSLTTDTPFVSLSTGGAQTLALNAGPSYGGDVYLVLGSITGIQPGLQINGVKIPLNFDGYMAHTLQLPNQPPLGNTLGSLDALGTAQATWSIPPLPSVLAGTTLEHAFIVVSAGTVQFASNAMPLTLVN